VALATALPVGSPSTSHTGIVVQVGFSPGRTLVAGGWDKSVLLWDVATHLARAVLVQPIFELVLRAAHT
jgi:WD40 repeat protein